MRLAHILPAPILLAHALPILMLAAATARAHEGHDHGPAVPEIRVEAAPRATAESEEFELVAVLEGGRLQLYLDRHASNEPVAGAGIEVESGAFKGLAQALAPGLYTLPGEAFAKPGKYPLTIGVQAGESADLLAATLEVPQPATTASPDGPPPWQAWWGIVLSGLMGLTALVFVLARLRERAGARGFFSRSGDPARAKPPTPTPPPPAGEGLKDDPS